MDENLYIRSIAAEYLIFSSQAGENGIEVRFEDGTAWLTQKAMAELFGVDRSVIGKHLKNVFAEGELEEKVVCALFAHTTQHGAIKRIIEMTALLLESGFCLPLFQQVQRRGNFPCRVRLRAVQDIRIAHCGLPHCGGAVLLGGPLLVFFAFPSFSQTPYVFR